MTINTYTYITDQKPPLKGNGRVTVLSTLYVHIIVLTPSLTGQDRVTVNTLCPHYCPNPLVEQTGCVVTSYGRALGKGSMAEEGTDGLCCNQLWQRGERDQIASRCLHLCQLLSANHVPMHPLHAVWNIVRLMESHMLMFTHCIQKDSQIIVC